MKKIFETVDYIPYEVVFVIIVVVFIAISLPKKYGKN